VPLLTLARQRTVGQRPTRLRIHLAQRV